jgi:hypothetical protein
MQNGQILDDKRSSPSASLAGGHSLPIDPESDYHSDDDHDTASRNGNGKRKRPISVSYVQFILSCLGGLCSPSASLCSSYPGFLITSPIPIPHSPSLIHITYLTSHVLPHTIPYRPVLHGSWMLRPDPEPIPISFCISLGLGSSPCHRVLPLHPMWLSLMTCVDIVQDLSPSGSPLFPPEHIELALTPLPLGASSANSAR